MNREKSSSGKSINVACDSDNQIPNTELLAISKKQSLKREFHTESL